MLLTDARGRLRVDLADIESVYLTDEVLDRAVQRAVGDLSRFLPLDKTLETTVVLTVTSEAWTSAAAFGTYVTLANCPIKKDSEAVKNVAALVCVRDIDYTIDYTNGKITHISGGKIANGTSCTISYLKSETAINISSIFDSLVRVERVEYPIGDSPQSFVSFEVWGNHLILKTSEGGSYLTLSAGDHVSICYKAKHTAPTPSESGSYPSFLDDTIMLAASAYALLSLAMSYEHQAVTDLEDNRTALSPMAAIHALIDTALDKVSTHVAFMSTSLDAAVVQAAAAATALGKINNDAGKTYLTDADTALDAFITAISLGATALAKVDTYLAGATDSFKAQLIKITTDAAQLRTAIGTANDAANTALDSLVFTSIGTYLSAAATALAKVDVYLSTNTSENAKFWLTKITTDIAGLRTAFLTAIDAANASLDGVTYTDIATYLAAVTTALNAAAAADVKAGTALDTVTIVAATTALTAAKAVSDAILTISLDKATTGAEAYLDAGDDTILTLGTQASRAENYANYSRARGEIAAQRVNVVAGYVQEASARIASMTALVGQAGGYSTAAGIYIASAAQSVGMAAEAIAREGQKVNQATGYLNEAATRLSNLGTYINQADAWGRIASGFIAEAGEDVNNAATAINLERTRIEQANGYIAEANTRIANLRAYTEQALAYSGISDGFISEANQRIALASQYINEAGTRVAIADRYLQEANVRVANAGAYVGEASGRFNICQAFIGEAQARIAEADRYLAEADRLQSTANISLTVAEKYRTESIERRNEVWSIWKDAPEFAPMYSITSTKQMTSAG
jgi:hypothetical protein